MLLAFAMLLAFVMLPAFVAAAAAQHPCPAGQTLLTIGSVPTCVNCPTYTYSSETGHTGECLSQPVCGTDTDDSEGPGHKFVDSQTTKRTCELCDDGTFLYKTQHQRMNCREWTKCDARLPPGLTQQVFTQPTVREDYTCTPSSVDGSNGHQPGRECDTATEYESRSFVANLRDRVCTLLTDCLPGEYVWRAPTSNDDRMCYECPAGHYSTTINAGSCTEITPPGVKRIYDYATMAANVQPVELGTPCPDGYETGPSPYIECVAVADTTTKMQTAIGLIFGLGGLVTLALYAVIVMCPPAQALDRDTTWGYLGRYGTTFKWAWAGFTLVTASAVLGLFAWIVFVRDDPPGDLALAATVVFISGAVTWPVGVVAGSLRTAQAGVLFAAAGSVLLLVGVLRASDAPALAIAAAAQVVFHHCVVDGLWAILGPAGSTMLGESLLQ